RHERLASTQGVEAQLPRRSGRLCREDLGSGVLEIGEAGGKANRAGQGQRDESVQDDPDERRLQSICRRMNVGISMAVTSWGARSLGVAGRAERVVSVGRVTALDPVEPATRVGRVCGNWMIGDPAGLAVVVVEATSPARAVPTCNARSNPVAMTVTR